MDSGKSRKIGYALNPKALLIMTDKRASVKIILIKVYFTKVLSFYF